MTRKTHRFTKQRTVLGVGVGKPRTDWTKVGKAGAVGAGAASAVAIGVAVWRGLFGWIGTLVRGATRLVGSLTGQVGNLTRGLGDATGQVTGQAERAGGRLAKAPQGARTSSTKAKKAAGKVAKTRRPGGKTTKASSGRAKRTAAASRGSNSGGNTNAAS